MKNPLSLRRNSVLKASFLHDDDDCNLNGELATDHLNMNIESEALTTIISTADYSNVDASTHNICSSYSSSDYSSDHDCSQHAQQVTRQTSLSTISASQNLKEETPHELAANVARNVKSHFLKNLPHALRAHDDNVGTREDGNNDCIAPFQTTEIVLGPLLGSGEFSHVHEIKSFQPKFDANSNDCSRELSDREMSTRSHMKKRERYHDTKKACYAVKHLRPTLLDTYSNLEYAQAACDLALEAEFLKCLVHPNIIKLRGLSAAGAGGFAQGPKGYFLIIDRLNETLDMRIKTWRKVRRRRVRAGLLSSSWKTKMLPLSSAAYGKLHHHYNANKDGSNDSSVQDNTNNKEKGGDKGGGSNNKKKNDAKSLISEDQVHVGLQISSALMYLHEKNIIFRDLKPQNIGFDVRGDVKLFDFGLASVMPPFGDPYEDTFTMSGAGSPRYMSPEVLIDPPDKYNLKADVYTFGIVLWEIFSLEVPFSNTKSRDALVDFVVDQEGRPTINENWPDPIKEVLQLSFDADIAKRPSIQLFYNVLRFQLLNLRDGDDTKLGNAFIKRRRSFGSLRDLGVSKDDDGGQQQQQEEEEEEEEEEQQSQGGNFPQRVKNTILSHVKSPPSSSNCDNNAQPRRRRNKLRDKFRLSIKQEE
mmetsp:Transcript_21342/g.46350  ORF Transcript_21342/g.46350 Transcript_21342/m.46350 type:complete len:645 (+) Transcript_21342:74-2008(+)